MKCGKKVYVGTGSCLPHITSLLELTPYLGIDETNCCRSKKGFHSINCASTDMQVTHAMTDSGLLTMH